MKLNIFNSLLSKAETIKKAETVLSDYLSTFNIRHYAFTFYRHSIREQTQPVYDCVSTGLSTWHHYYLSQYFGDTDQTLADAYQQLTPVFWDVKEQLKLAKKKREKQIRLESIEYGINKGLSIPVHGPYNDFSSLTLHQFNNESCLDNYIEHEFEWLAAAKIYYTKVKSLCQFQAANNKIGLTKRELQCLSLTADGYSIEKIATLLKITPRTVNFHIQNANKKLGVKNKYQGINKLQQDPTTDSLFHPKPNKGL